MGTAALYGPPSALWQLIEASAERDRCAEQRQEAEQHVRDLAAELQNLQQQMLDASERLAALRQSADRCRALLPPDDDGHSATVAVQRAQVAQLCRLTGEIITGTDEAVRVADRATWTARVYALRSEELLVSFAREAGAQQRCDQLREVLDATGAGDGDAEVTDA